MCVIISVVSGSFHSEGWRGEVDMFRAVALMSGVMMWLIFASSADAESPWRRDSSGKDDAKIKEVEKAANFKGGWTTGAQGARPTLDNRYWRVDGRGNLQPTLSNRYWTTDSMGRLRPTLQNRYWTSDSRGNLRPTLSNRDWTVDSSGRIRPTLSNKNWSTDAQGRPRPTLGNR